SRRYGLPFSVCRGSAIVPIVATLALSLWLGSLGERSIGKAVMLACVWMCAATDLQSGYVFDWVSLGSLPASLLLATQTHQLFDAVAGAGLGGGLMLVVYIATAGRGIGLGDVKLAAA